MRTHAAVLYEREKPQPYAQSLPFIIEEVERDIPRLISLYQAGRLPLDMLLSPSLALEDINEGFDKLAQGTAVRQLVRFNG